MKKALAATFWLVSTLSLYAQLNYGSPEANPFVCQPGVIHKSPGKGASVSYFFNPDFHMSQPGAEDPSEVSRNERFDAKMKIPLLMQEKNKLMLGIQYAVERYHFTEIVPENYPMFRRLNEADLKTTGAAIYYHHSINHRLYLGFRIGASWYGDYKSFVTLKDRYAVYKATALLGVKKRQDLEFGIGFQASKNFRNANVSLLPFGFYNRTFNDHWGIEASLPVSIKGRYNFNQRTLILFGPEYSGQSYSLDVEQPSTLPGAPLEKAIYHFQRTNIEFGTSLMRQMSGWTWLEFKVGYSTNLSSQAKDVSEHPSFNLKPSSSVVGAVSFFLSPPRHSKGE